MINLFNFKSSLKSLIYLFIILQSNYISSNHINQSNQIKPCSIKQSNGCPNRQSIKSTKSSHYINDNIQYKLTPTNHTSIKKIDVYHSKYNLKNDFKINDKFKNSSIVNITDLPVSEALIKPIYSLPDNITLDHSFLLNATSLSLPLKLTKNKHYYEDIYGQLQGNEESKEKIEQINKWLNAESSSQNTENEHHVQVEEKQVTLNHLKARKPDVTSNLIDKNLLDMKTSETKQSLQREPTDYVDYEDDQHSLNKLLIEKKNSKQQASNNNNFNLESSGSSLSGTKNTPPCATPGRFYCSFKEDYPDSVVAEITRYYKWPLEKLFRDLRQQVMPKLANDVYGALVCDSITRIVRPGWARNTANRWLVVINTEEYQQYVTEILCRDPGSRCNFVAPCYSAGCTQRFNTQKLLVIDPFNRFKGPFLSEFLFPSCCVCFIPEYQSNNDDHPHHLPIASNLRSKIKKAEDKANMKIEF